MTHTPQPALLTPDEEIRLATAIEVGVLAGEALRRGQCPCGATINELITLEREGREAWQHFLLANQRLVWMVARKEARVTGLSADDLFQEGFVALAGALQRFDHRRARFSTYALPRIRQHLAEVAARRMGEIPLSTKRAVQLRRALGLAAELSQQRGGTVELSELASALGRSEEWTAQLVSQERPPARLDEVDPAWFAREDLQVLESGSEACDAVRRAVLRLPADLREVVMLRFGFGGDPKACAEVASRLRVSQSTVRRLERRALDRLRIDARAS